MCRRTLLVISTRPLKLKTSRLEELSTYWSWYCSSQYWWSCLDPFYSVHERIQEHASSRVLLYPACWYIQVLEGISLAGCSVFPTMSNICTLKNFFLVIRATYWFHAILVGTTNTARLGFCPISPTSFSLHCLAVSKFCTSNFSNFAFKEFLQMFKKIYLLR